MGIVHDLHRAIAAIPHPIERRCALCDHRVGRFLPYRGGRTFPLMRALDVIGSDTRNFECPRCGAHDRERHLLMYLQASGILDGMNGKTLLHFAPEKRLSHFLCGAHLARYLPCDLFPQSAEVKAVDMLAMPFEQGSFDVVIANHVLEHVNDDTRALSEIHRVLKPDGFAILQTPYSSRLHQTWQDSGIDDPEARLQAYGQEDHVRLYGRDIFDRIVAAGFESHVKKHSELLACADSTAAGVNPAEPFFLFRKRG